MTIQTVELHGERYVILPEREFLEMQGKLPASQSPQGRPSKFREVTPLKVSGIPASELLIRDRR